MKTQTLFRDPKTWHVCTGHPQCLNNDRLHDYTSGRYYKNGRWIPEPKDCWTEKGRPALDFGRNGGIKELNILFIETKNSYLAPEQPKASDNPEIIAEYHKSSEIDLSPVSVPSSPIVATNWTPERLLRAVQPIVDRVQAKLSPKRDTKPISWKQRRYLFVLTGRNYGKNEMSMVQVSDMISTLTKEN